MDPKIEIELGRSGQLILENLCMGDTEMFSLFLERMLTQATVVEVSRTLEKVVKGE